MNILGFIFLLLFFLSLQHKSFLSETCNTTFIEKMGKGYVKAHNNALDHLVHIHFIKHPGKVVGSPEKSSPRKDNKNPQKKWKKQTFCSCSKMDLSFFLHKKNLSLDPSYLLFKRLLSNVYGSLFQKIHVEAFLEELHKTLLESKKDPFSWENVTFKSEEMQLIFYRMIKGTKFYNRSRKEGFPSLLKLITIKKEDTLCLPCISFEMLEALFGFSYAEKLWETKEKELEMLLVTEEEVKAILKETIPCLEKLHFTHKREKEETFVLGENKETEVQVTWKKPV